ncbi:MAG: SurA N-terminal domain-containing protein [Treponema sp.]|nr:SurA N-terminal domain-containing protein [Treponema sp.]
MKKIILVLTMLFVAAGAVFAQSDLQPLVIVKYNKAETITLKQFKTYCDTKEKQVGQKFTLEQRKQLLTMYIDERLVLQAAAKAGLTIPNSTVDQYFNEQMSQLVGMTITEKQLNDELKKQKNTTLDEELLAQTGMNVADYKTWLKEQMIIRQYVMQVKQDEMQAASTPTDAEIRSFYEGNKASLVWSDMVKLFYVSVEKGSNADSAKNKINELRNKYVDKKMSKEQMITQSQISGSGYVATEGILPKTEAGAASIGLTYDSIIGLYEQNEGYISEVAETDNAYVFIALTGKYAAKMLGLSDIMTPDTTVTVYEYIRSYLANQKASTYFSQAAQEIADELHTSQNVEEKKTGAALEKLLNWGD